MITMASIISKLQEKYPGEKLSRIALRHGIDPAHLRLWARDKVFPNEENCILLADAAELDRKEVLLAFSVWRSANKSDDLNLAWRELEMFYRSKKSA